MGVKAVEALLEGQTDMMVGLRGMGISTIPLDEVTSESRTATLSHHEMAKMLAGVDGAAPSLIRIRGLQPRGIFDSGANLPGKLPKNPATFRFGQCSTLWNYIHPSIFNQGGLTNG